MKCPNCQHELPPAKRAKRPILASVTDTAGMKTAEVFAHYKRTAPLEDVRFILRSQTRMSAELRAGFEALEACLLNTTIARPAFNRQFSALMAIWRQTLTRRSWPYAVETDELIAQSA